MIRYASALVFSAMLLAAAPAPPAASAPPQRWLAVSDVHFDPFADPHLVDRLAQTTPARWRSVFARGADQPFAAYGSDTNDALLESSLDAMHEAVPEPAVVIISGDMLAHNFREKFDRTAKAHDDANFDAFVDKTIAFLADEFREAFPRAQLIPAIGNDDGYCGDYRSTPHSAFLSDMAAAWGGSVGAADPRAFVTQFSTGGYYTVPLPAGNAQAIVLNDVFWSAKYENSCGDKTADPGADEASWLQATLKAAGTSPVWVVTHVPPGADVYSTLHAPAGSAPVMFLAERFNADLLGALGSQSPLVVMTIAGHTHMNAFQVIGPGASRPLSPLLDVPSVSPIFGNNPSFTVLDVEAATAVVDDAQYFILSNLPALSKDAHAEAHWKREYDFRSTYGDGRIDATHLSDVQQAMFDDDRIRHRFQTYYDGSSGRAPITESTWRAYWCANVALTQTQYVSCAAPQIQWQLPAHPAPPAPSPTATPSPVPSPIATP